MKPTLNDHIVKVINTAITSKGVKLTYLSEKTGMSVNQISQTLMGKRNLKGDELISLANEIGLTLKDFISIDKTA